MDFKIAVLLFLSLQFSCCSTLSAGTVLDKALANFQEQINNLKDVFLCGSCKPIKGGNGCDCRHLEPMEDCLAFYQSGYRRSGPYTIRMRGANATVYCDQQTQGGGWTVLMRRKDGSVNFVQNWQSYKAGFGDLLGEFWLGNQNIHDLTKPSFASMRSELLINMRIKGQTNNVYAKYDTFEIGDEASKYTLNMSGPSGTVPDPGHMMYHNLQKFSTYDSDNDLVIGRSCCHRHGRVGWWFRSCFRTLLTGVYRFRRSEDEIVWNNNDKVKPEFVEMKIRRKV
ncbi:fibrinogen-like protein A [Clytia hemisphaerica]|uniref:fibrinogen-like protein A n=1 Tax=Clytia hemisphaerica TaxID=252671 RepID=UPI0034D39C07